MRDLPGQKRGRPSKKKDLLDGMVVLDTKTVREKQAEGNAKKNLYGNPANNTLYRPNYPKLVQKLMAAGCTQFEVAQDLGVSEQTLYKWCNQYPEFAQALRAGFDKADDRVELALLSKATGHKWVEEVKSKTINDEGEEVEEVTQITKQVPPDNSAIFFWLKNRRAHRWKDKHEVTINQNVQIVTSNDLQMLVAQHIDDADYKVIEPEQP